MKLTIDNNEFKFYPGSQISLIYDSIASSFSFRGLQETLPRPLDYNRCQIIDDENNNEILITGTILNPSYISTSKPQLNSLSGYSLPGVLEDCTIPLESYPLQSDNLTLKEIVDKYFEPFDIQYVVTNNVSSEFNKKYKKTSVDPEQKIKEYINSLASQRGIILTHDNQGRVVFTKVDLSILQPVATFEEGNPGITEMSFRMNGQLMHSEILVIKQASSKNPDAGQYLIDNPYVGSFRPITKILNDGDIFDVQTAARNELGSELENIVLNIKTTKFVKPGQLIQFKSETLKVNRLTDFFVRQTNITSTEKGDTYELTCVVKDAFTDNPVENIFL